jgi:FtsP/CotA-like multicopper oxidase with cupredoxin domain
MIVAPDLPILPCRIDGGVKLFELRAEPVARELLPGIWMEGWGYNGSIPGPLIVVRTGDDVIVRVDNRLPVPTSVHWHGLDVPNTMDGVPELEPTPLIQPGQRYDYRFQITNRPGTHMYHSHVDVVRQIPMGLGGMIVIMDPNEQGIAHDYVYMVQQFRLLGLSKGELAKGHYRIDPYSDDFNFFTMNGRCFPYVRPMLAKRGDKVRIRIGNIGMDAHPMHLHGHQFQLMAMDGNKLLAGSRPLMNTISVASGETRDIEFVADNPGRWPFHCHIPHHNANNFTSKLGGMFTFIHY